MDWWIAAAVTLVVLVVVAVWVLKRRAGGGPVSIVMMRPAVRTLTEAEVRHAVRQGLGASATVERIPIPNDTTQGYIVMAEGYPPLAVIAATRAYCDPDEIAGIAARFEDPDVRRALEEHKAWVSVDAMGLKRTPPLKVRTLIYNEILGKVAARLLDDGCSLLYLPADKRVAKPGKEAEQMLSGARVMKLFSDDDAHAPVIHAKADDRAIEKAIEEARRRLPELVRGLEERLGARGEIEALVKGKFETPDGQVEYLWGKVEAMTESGFQTEMLNRAVRPEFPKRGEKVDIEMERVVDWVYVDGAGKSHGGFVEKVIRGRM